MKKFGLIVVLVCTFSLTTGVVGSNPSFAGALDELSPSVRADVEKALANRSGPKVLRRAVEGSYWPEFKIFHCSTAKPENVAAVFVDVDHHKEFFSELGISKSELLNGKGTSKMEVAYFLKFPMGLGSDDYTVVDQLTALRDGYAVSWEVMRSTAGYSKGDAGKVYSRGNVQFESYQNGTLIAYTSLISPKSRIGVGWSWVVDGAEQTVKDLVSTLAKQTEKELVSDPRRMEQQLADLSTALAH